MESLYSRGRPNPQLSKTCRLKQIESQIYQRFLNNKKVHSLDLQEDENYDFLKTTSLELLKETHSLLNRIAIPATYNRYKAQLKSKELRTGKPQGLPCLSTKEETWAYNYIKNKKGFLKAKVHRQFLIAGRLTDLFIERYPVSIEIAGDCHDNINYKAHSDLVLLEQMRNLNVTHLHIENKDVHITLPQRLDTLLLKHKTDTRVTRRALRRIYSKETQNWLLPAEAKGLIHKIQNRKL